MGHRNLDSREDLRRSCSPSSADKAATRPAGSGTVAELDAGVHAIGKKVVEEAAEVWMAAEHEGDERTAEEISPAAVPPAGADARLAG